MGRAAVDVALAAGCLFLAHFAAARPVTYRGILPGKTNQPTKVEQVGQGVIDFLGEADVKRKDSRGFVVLSKDGQRRFRMDFEGHASRRMLISKCSIQKDGDLSTHRELWKDVLSAVNDEFEDFRDMLSRLQIEGLFVDCRLGGCCQGDDHDPCLTWLRVCNASS